MIVISLIFYTSINSYKVFATVKYLFFLKVFTTHPLLPLKDYCEEDALARIENSISFSNSTSYNSTYK